MSTPRLVVIPGAVPRRPKQKPKSVENEMVKRWRTEGPLVQEAHPSPDPRDVIPLLDGWIRKLERQAAAGPEKRR